MSASRESASPFTAFDWFRSMKDPNGECKDLEIRWAQMTVSASCVAKLWGSSLCAPIFFSRFSSGLIGGVAQDSEREPYEFFAGRDREWKQQRGDHATLAALRECLEEKVAAVRFVGWCGEGRGE